MNQHEATSIGLSCWKFLDVNFQPEMFYRVAYCLENAIEHSQLEQMSCVRKYKLVRPTSRRAFAPGQAIVIPSTL